MMMKINPENAKHLAQVVNGIRPDWELDGIYKALGHAQDKGNLAEITLAAVHAALTPTNRTPAVIAYDGAHWTHAPTQAKAQTEKPCPVHTPIGPAWNCAPCRAEYLGTGTWPENTKHHQAERRN